MRLNTRIKEYIYIYIYIHTHTQSMWKGGLKMSIYIAVLVYITWKIALGIEFV